RSSPVVLPLVSYSLSFFFFPLLRPPPTSPLFPYTTLFRSDPADSIDRALEDSGEGIRVVQLSLVILVATAVLQGVVVALSGSVRSEEHTSELQSRENLVCRLLLEKKKKNNESYNIKKKSTY